MSRRKEKAADGQFCAGSNFNGFSRGAAGKCPLRPESVKAEPGQGVAFGRAPVIQTPARGPDQ
jgi:hypothetical protein